jgi:PhnB protein
MQVQPYLFFNGRCEEAADFYRRTIGAEEIMRCGGRTALSPSNLAWSHQVARTR